MWRSMEETGTFVAATFIMLWEAATGAVTGVLANFGPNSQTYTARMAHVSH